MPSSLPSAASQKLQPPAIAVARTAVFLDVIKVDLVLLEGRLTLEAELLKLIMDSAEDLRPEARKCCASLFGLPTATTEVPSGLILMEVELGSVESVFYPKETDWPCRFFRLPAQDYSPLRLSQCGPAGRILLEDEDVDHVELEPMEVTITGPIIEIGRGTEAVQAWVERLQASLANLESPPPPTFPPSCMAVRFLQANVCQDATDDSGFTVGGSWPFRVLAPRIEVTSSAAISGFSAAVQAGPKNTISQDSLFDDRAWWQPPVLAPKMAKDGMRRHDSKLPTSAGPDADCTSSETRTSVVGQDLTCLVGHPMHMDRIPYSVCCNVCDRRVPPQDTVYGCRQCGYAMCVRCSSGDHAHAMDRYSARCHTLSTVEQRQAEACCTVS